MGGGLFNKGICAVSAGTSGSGHSTQVVTDYKDTEVTMVI